MDLTSCPECGAVAEVQWRHVLESTDGPVEHAQIRCTSQHWFFLPVSYLSRAGIPGRPGRPSVVSRCQG
ncbi:hypothetical protein [Nocardioides sp.]|uniref:hypothetical protein n=1 Tax=Nocardioides sp. TaxID=35761 RepID=UPI003D0BD7A9